MQYFKFPMKVVNISQTPDNNFSHKGSVSAWDNAGADIRIDDAFAPTDSEIVWLDKGSAKTGCLITNTVEAKMPNGVIAKPYTVNSLYWHDNDTSDLYVGKKLKQGEVFYQEGTAGHATGNHVHFNVGIFSYKKGTYPLTKNSSGVYEIKGEIDPTKVFFVDDSNVIKNTKGMKWTKYIEEVNKPNINKLSTDGRWSVEFTKALQNYFGTSVDGIISGQLLIIPNVKVMKKGNGGSQLIRAIQKWCVINQDGYLGKSTVRAMQKKMGTKVDGIISDKSSLVYQIQLKLNEGKL